MDNLIDMEAVNRKYYEKSGLKITTNKNQAADLLREVASAIGADLNLIKEGQLANQRFVIHESDLNHIFKMLDRAKMPDGKRLRCRDYRSAGGDCIEFFIEAFCHLFEAAGCTEGRCNRERAAMHIKTEFVAMISRIRETAPKFADDVEHRLFAPNDDYPNQDDHLEDTDQFVFLYYMLQRSDLSREEMRCIYWFFCMEVEIYYREDFMTEVRKYQQMDEQGRSEFKDYMHRRLNFDKALETDQEYQDALNEWYRVESGQGKLQDNMRRKELTERLFTEMNRVASQYLKPSGSDVAKTEEKKKPDNLWLGIKKAEYLLHCAIGRFAEFTDYRIMHPASELREGEEKMFEYLFRFRFNEPMFEWLEIGGI